MARETAHELILKWSNAAETIRHNFRPDSTYKLRSMNAHYDVNCCGDALLYSYNTLVAVYDASQNTLYRLDYSYNGGRTPTTERQITTFYRDYCPDALWYKLYIPNDRIIMSWSGDDAPLKVDANGYTYYVDLLTKDRIY